MYNGTNKIAINNTRYDGLGYANTNPIGKACWRVVDLHEPGRQMAVGPLYNSKAELLADFERYAKDSWGY